MLAQPPARVGSWHRPACSFLPADASAASSTCRSQGCRAKLCLATPHPAAAQGSFLYAERPSSRSQSAARVPFGAKLQLPAERRRGGSGWFSAIRALLEAWAGLSEGHAGPSPTALLVVLSACARDGAWSWVLELLARAQQLGPVPGLAARTAAISSCRRAGLWPRALQLLADMPRRWGLRPDAVAHNAAMAVCERASCWPRALWLLRGAAVDEGIVPTVAGVNSVFSACGRAGLWAQALGLLSDLSDSSAGGLRPDAVSYSAVVTGCEKASCWPKALLLFQAMRRRGTAPDTVACNGVLAILAAGRQWRAALRFLASMPSEAATGGSCQSDEISHSTVVDACVADGCWEVALSLLARMPQTGLRFSLVACSAGIGACAGRGGTAGAAWQVAFGLLQYPRLHMASPDLVAYSSAIGVAAAASQWLQALLLMRGLVASQLRIDSMAHNTAVSACQKASNWRAALELLAWRRTSGLGADSMGGGAALLACCEERAGEEAATWAHGLAMLGSLAVVRVMPSCYALAALLTASEQQSLLSPESEILSALSTAAVSGQMEHLARTQIP
ncbi:unnamed protein product [Polarella glacialis]|uniref:Pentatricopeptide repeat-containing protein, chloroplastic n=1 Tax=Polarella glacialis TaxID=89957 RepID=A0A813FPS1_POLGL|nr:unnamed protein product [Polarella glacialis]CAE8736745.1 unnamed protein product [Polarella glacialis]